MISPILSCFYQILNVRMMRTTRRTVKSTDWMTFATRTHMECTGTAPSLVDFAVSSLFHIDTAMLKAAVCFGFKTFQWIVVALICNEKHPSSKGMLLWADNVIFVSFFSLFYFWVLKSGKNSEKQLEIRVSQDLAPVVIAMLVLPSRLTTLRLQECAV